VPFAPGGAVDTIARVVGEKMRESFGQPVIVENHPGASANIGAELVAKAAPDGYTILLGANALATNATLFPRLAFSYQTDFAPIGRIDSASFVLAVSASLPVQSVAELVAYAKARPGALNYASSGNGTTAHLSGTLFNNKAGVDLKHIPYNSVPQALVDLSSGAVAIMFYPYQPLIPVVQTNKVRLLATTGQKRASYLPNLPTVIEAGIPDFVALAWHGFYAPAGTPKAVIDIIYAALAKAMADPKVIAGLVASGIDVDLAPAAEFARFTRQEVDRYRVLIALAGAKI
jgi:tripartite-type tricarboxylate transporter receptor subunit TctC